MQADKRRIQTAVLGGADSDEPLMLPMEAIELDAFRHAHEGDTFWCGTLLGGCGGQLTTKLYTDRACHYAHHPDADGQPHVCGRRARGVNSADHLYVRSAAAAWLARWGQAATVEYTRPDGAPLGSVVDVRWQHGALRVHLDQAVAPVWDNATEPVLGTMIPVDRDTLIRRWYVHRIRLQSVGTARHVQIGTEAFARPIAWFTLDECEVTERGLSTPAVEEIVQARKAPRPTLWSPGNAKKTPEPEARAQALLRRLAYARRIESVSLAKEVCGQIEDLAGAGEGTQEQLEAAVRHAKGWLAKQNEKRAKLFDRLARAVAKQKPGRVRRLLIQANATAAQDRTEAEEAVHERATEYFAKLDDSTRAAAKAEATTEDEAQRAAASARKALRRLRRHDAYTHDLRPHVEGLLRWAPLAGELLKDGEARRVEVWKERAAQGPQRRLQVAERYWIRRSCPRCNAEPDYPCVLTEGPDTGKKRDEGHYERLQLIEQERKAANRTALQQKKPTEKPVRGTDPGRPAKKRPPKQQKKAGPALHRRVPAHDWYRKKCPQCHAAPGNPCDNDDSVGPGKKRQVPHEERLSQALRPTRAGSRPSRPRRKDRQVEETTGSAARTWHAPEVTCPKCKAAPNTSCTPNGMHHERVEWAREFTRRLWG